VAVPGIAERLLTILPQAIREALERVKGFAGCAVMVSEREVRLVTVVTFWRGKDRERQASSTAHWVEKLLDPYVDRQLRMHKLRVQIALQPETRTYCRSSAELTTSEMSLSAALQE
jgi:heme-degrading monooxygenase HmoA